MPLTSLTPEQRAAALDKAAAALAKLSKETPKVMTAYKNITSQAKDSCKVDLPALK